MSDTAPFLVYCVSTFAALASRYGHAAWKSKKHADGSMFEGWFVAGIMLPHGQVTYHLPLRWWDDFDARELERAPEWDGHTSDDVISRLKSVATQ